MLKHVKTLSKIQYRFSHGLKTLDAIFERHTRIQKKYPIKDTDVFSIFPQMSACFLSGYLPKEYPIRERETDRLMTSTQKNIPYKTIKFPTICPQGSLTLSPIWLPKSLCFLNSFPFQNLLTALYWQALASATKTKIAWKKERTKEPREREREREEKKKKEQHRQ